jgi:hypothetical protein
MNTPVTREKYKGRLTNFFNFIGLNVGTIEGRAKGSSPREATATYVVM